jgi:signal transduction histidine kinase
LISGEEKERKRIAQDLHDGLGALLATVKLRFNAIQNEIPNMLESESFLKADELLDEACVEIRGISHKMMPRILEKGGLELALRELCQDSNRPSEVEVSYVSLDIPPNIPKDKALAIYRVTQELLKNALKHANASEIIVQLQGEEERLNLTVEDDGKGFDPSTVLTGLGLEGIQSRISFFDGSVDLDSIPGQGTSFHISL